MLLSATISNHDVHCDYHHPASPSDETTDDPEFPVVVVAAVAGTAMVLLVAVFCVGLTTLICCHRKRRDEFT